MYIIIIVIIIIIIITIIIIIISSSTFMWIFRKSFSFCSVFSADTLNKAELEYYFKASNDVPTCTWKI
jgi:uncharacterized protein YpmB